MPSFQVAEWQDSIRHFLFLSLFVRIFGIETMDIREFWDSLMQIGQDLPPIDKKYTTGYSVFVGGNLISWKSQKENESLTYCFA